MELQPPGTGEGRCYFVKCPCCGWSHKLFKTGKAAIERNKPILTVKGWFKFDSGKMDMNTAPFIDVRDMTGGRGRGLYRIPEECLTLKQAMQREKYQEIIESLRNQIKQIEKILKVG